MKEKKTLVALALSAVLPSLTHPAPRLEYSIGSGATRLAAAAAVWLPPDAPPNGVERLEDE